MTKKVLFALLALMTFASAEVLAQAQLQRLYLPLKVVYHNKGFVADTCNETADTLRIGILGKGGLAPVGVALTFTARDADVTATPDSMDVTFRAGIGGKYATIGVKTLTISGTLPGVATRTLVFNTTGAAVALNTQAAVWPYCDAIELFIENGSGGTTTALNDTIRYTVDALGIYESGRFAQHLPVRYKNKGATADSALGTTIDTVRVGVTQFGDAAPLGVGVLFFAKDVDVSAAADTLLASSFGSITARPGTFYNLATGTAFGEAFPIVSAGTATGIRTYVFNTTGAAATRNTQATVSPYFRTLELRVAADDAGDTTRYEIKALGIYQKN